ncbi:WD40 repeat-like protein [Rhizoctonia solani]|uniref:WD40 repeat-like protein n=1 Tax=Rhizoctonia solani TaxID=456999 RepID=A0A8H7IE37_9AGAM|nr:WD40 repeat-like protein [Rhizoctonia solani]
MLQSSVIPSTHADLITDTVYNYYGVKLATGGIDQKIKIWKLNELTGVWSMVDEWKAHDAPVAKIAWAHPEYGTLLASCSYDRTVKIWEDARGIPDASGPSKFQLKATLTEARGTVTIASDNIVRIYECHETYHLNPWLLVEEFDAAAIAVTPVSGESPSGATPTQTNTALSDTPPTAPSGISLQRSGAAAASNPPNKPVGVKEADGAWCVQWLKDKFSEIIAVSCGTQAVVKIIALQPGKPPQLLATGSRDHKVRIFKLWHGERDAFGEDGFGDGTSARADQSWSFSRLGEFDDHKATVGRVEWNITGTILSSAGDDGKIRLWKATFNNVWRSMGTLGAVESADGDAMEQ